MTDGYRGHQDARWNQRDIDGKLDRLLWLACRYRAVFSTAKAGSVKSIDFQVLLSLFQDRSINTINGLATRFSTSHTAIANAVLRLEGEGYVEVAYREPRQGDSREKQLSLTELGRSRTLQLTSIAIEAVPRLK